MDFAKYSQAQAYFAHSVKMASRYKTLTAVCVMAALFSLIAAVVAAEKSPLISLVNLGLAGAALGCIVRLGIVQIRVMLKYAALKYEGTSKKLSLPIMITPEYLMDSLVWKFDYPYCKGIHYDLKGECAIQGRYGVYAIEPSESENGWFLNIDTENVKKFQKHFSFMEAITVRSILNRFFNSNSTNDAVGDLNAQNFVVRRVRFMTSVTIAAVFGLIGLLCLAAGIISSL